MHAAAGVPVDPRLRLRRQQLARVRLDQEHGPGPALVRVLEGRAERAPPGAGVRAFVGTAGLSETRFWTVVLWELLRR